MRFVNTTNPTASSTVLTSAPKSCGVWNTVTKFETPTKLYGPMPVQFVKA